MRWKITILLLLLNISIFYGIFYFKQQQPNSISHFKNIWGIAIVDIDRLEIINKAYKEPRIIERQNGQWKITSPIEWPANLFAIQRIITQLQFLIHEAHFSIEELEASGQSLENYGLKDPNIILKFHGINGKHTLFIGNATHLGNRLYVMDPDQKKVLVIKDSLLDSIIANLEDLRTEQIFNIPFFELNKLKIQLLHPHNLKIWLSKEKGSWVFDAPIQTNANNILVNNAINQLSAIHINKILLGHEAEEARQLLHNPFMKLTLEGNNQKQILVIAKPEKQNENDSEYYAQLEDNSTVFTVSSKPFTALQDAQEELRDKQLITVDPDTLKNLTILQGDNKIQLQKLEDDKWQLITHDSSGKLTPFTADQEEMNKIQKRLQALTILSFASDAPSNADLENFGFTDPQRIIKLEGDKTQVLLIGQIDPSSGNLYAKLSESPYIYLINPNILSFLPVNELHYKVRLLEKLPKGASINGLKIIYLGQKEKTLFDQHFNTDNIDWETILSSLNDNKRKSITGIIDGIKEFKVRNYLKNNFENKASLDPAVQFPWILKIQAEIALASGDSSEIKTVEYFFTKRLSGNLQIGGSSEKNVTFSADQNWIDDLFVFQEEIQSLEEN